MALDRLALIKARLSKPKAEAYQPPGLHVAVNPEEKVTRTKGKLWDYNPETKGGPKTLVLSDFQKAENVAWYKEAEERSPRALLELSRVAKQPPLTTIAFAESERVPRVPPWQK